MSTAERQCTGRHRTPCPISKLCRERGQRITRPRPRPPHRPPSPRRARRPPRRPCPRTRPFLSRTEPCPSRPGPRTASCPRQTAPSTFDPGSFQRRQTQCLVHTRGFMRSTQAVDKPPPRQQHIVVPSIKALAHPFHIRITTPGFSHDAAPAKHTWILRLDRVSLIVGEKHKGRHATLGGILILLLASLLHAACKRET